MRHVLITLLLMASTAHAENWLQLAKLDRNGSKVFVDTAASRAPIATRAGAGRVGG